MIDKIANNTNSPTLIIFWQFILKALEELTIVSSPILSLEMLVVKLAHLKEMPSYENILESLKKNNLNEQEEKNNSTIDLNINKKKFVNDESEIKKISKDQIKNTTQTKPFLSFSNPEVLGKNVDAVKVLSFEDLISLTSIKKEIQLKYDLENNVNLIKFSEGKIDISFNERLDKNFVRNLSERLLEWTGNRWVITLAKQAGQKTFSELKKIKIKKILDEEKESETYKKFKNVFPDAELLEVKKKD